jgi:osmoprotectant transport system ATP-binding protein
MNDGIQFDGVAKRYGSAVALDGVSLEVPARTTTAVVGPTGSGKSTLLMLVNGLVRPDRGTVRVGDAPIDYDRLPDLRRRLGYAVQGSGLFPHLTALRNITLPAVLVGWDRERIGARAAELMRLVGLPEALADRYPYQLSGGEQQRVGLCRAMFLDPPIFLLDEPFGALDAITRAEIHAEFLRLERLRPRTILLVTHDLRAAVKLAQRIVVMREGRIEQAGTRDEVVRTPATGFVRELLDPQLGEGPGSGGSA